MAIRTGAAMDTGLLPRKRRTQENRKVTRMRLIHAAQSLLMRKGFDDALVDEISDAARYSRGAFNSNFEGRRVLQEPIPQIEPPLRHAELRQKASAPADGGHADFTCRVCIAGQPSSA